MPRFNTQPERSQEGTVAAHAVEGRLLVGNSCVHRVLLSISVNVFGVKKDQRCTFLTRKTRKESYTPTEIPSNTICCEYNGSTGEGYEMGAKSAPVRAPTSRHRKI